MPDFRANLERIRGRIAAAAARAGRDPAPVRLVAVTKTVDARAVASLAALGVADFGENRVQDALPKIAAVGPGPRWHFIGGLQRNKVRKALSAFSVVHAVDDLALGRQIAQVAVETGWTGQVLVQVNVAGERQKGGVAPEEAEVLVVGLRALPGLRIEGLMTMAPLDPDPERARPHFRELARLRERLRAATGLALPELSMGMSQDFETAVEEGATLVRVGSALVA